MDLFLLQLPLQVLAAVQTYFSSCVPCTHPSAQLTFSMSPLNRVKLCVSGRRLAASRWWSVTTTAGPTTWPVASCRCTTAESASHQRPLSRRTDQVLPCSQLMWHKHSHLLFLLSGIVTVPEFQTRRTMAKKSGGIFFSIKIIKTQAITSTTKLFSWCRTKNYTNISVRHTWQNLAPFFFFNLIKKRRYSDFLSHSPGLTTEPLNTVTFIK